MSVRPSANSNNAVGSVDTTSTSDTTAPQFQTTWSAALGASSNAAGDGGKWTEVSTDPYLKVIADSDFPGGRALYVGYHGTNTSTGGVGGWGHLDIPNPAPWPVPATGQTLFHRWYFENAITVARDLSIGGSHPMEGWGTDPTTGRNCAFHWDYKFDAHADGTFNWKVVYANESAIGTYTNLKKGQVYLMEVAYTKHGPNAYSVRVRLNGTDVTAQMGLTTAVIPISDYCLNSLFLGNNDPGYGSNTSDTDPTRWRNYDGSAVPGGPYDDIDSFRWGAVAVAVRNDSTAWIGPYVP